MSVVARPLLGNWHFRRDVPTFLMVAYWDPCNISTIPEYVAAWQQASRFNIAVLNLWPNSGSALTLPASVDLDDFDGVILHPTVSYFPANLFNLDARLTRAFDRYCGLKVLVKQDEHVQSAKWVEFIATKRFDVLVTCLSPAEVRKVYPADVVGDIAIMHALTGYVPAHFREISSRSLSERGIDIGYRGSIQPLHVGRLGFEKREVGYAVARATAGSDLRVDISSRWEDRITGPAWLDFLASSRIVLGTESGSCLFDFDGSVDRWCQDYTVRNAHLDSTCEGFYRTAHDEFLHGYEGNVDYATVSPRHFEAAATRSLQLLYEGRYAGIFEPYRHFLPLKRDLSNLGELLELARDERRTKEITDAAFDEVIMNERFTYKTFVGEFDDVVERLLDERRPPRARPATMPAKRRALVLMSHDPILDPRIDWISKGLLARGFDVIELGTYPFSEIGPGPSLETLPDGRKRVRIERTRHDFAFFPNPGEVARGLSAGRQVLLGIYTSLTLPEAAWRARIGAADLDHATTDRFRFFCSHFVDTNSALIQGASQIGHFDVIMAEDFDVLPAAEALAEEQRAALVYDAHEYWPHSHPLSRYWEREFWGEIERTLSAKADIRVTVSPALAAQMSQDYSVAFASVPNCEPLSSMGPPRSRDASPDQVIFLYQGNFAQGRNLEQLIAQWPTTDPRAILWLRGPHWSYTDQLVHLARGTGLLGSRIFFPDAVTVAELVNAAAQADVGIIPYDHTMNGNKYACPNKLSQYMGGGLPILTTELDFVASLVRRHDLGAVFSFTGQPSLAKVTSLFVEDRVKLGNCAHRAREFFRSEFNWEVVSKSFYDKLDSLVRLDSITDRMPLDFTWVEAGRTMRQSARPQTTPMTASPSDDAAESFPLRVLGLIPKNWRRGIRRQLPERLVTQVMARLS
jgi:glycosyltransferase involved in cell wall biosynthesis